MHRTRNMNKNFRFDSLEHKYYLGDEEMPSLSKIIEPLNDFGNIHPDVLAAKAQAGSDIHETIKFWLDGTLDEATLAEGNRIALDLFCEWYRNVSSFGVLLEYETPTYHEKLKYGTTPDLVFEEAIVEIKTRKPVLYRDSVQLVAQSKCFPEFPPKSLWVLSLDIVEKKNIFQKAEHKQSWSIFRKLLDKYKSDKEIETLIKAWKGQ
ncbi:MAG: hypothetical protein BroJett002_37270 [Candidatus Brocadia sinica]|nr:MAG: hypothetical protein BroJett002_37270 [Candidatus Brocadia sinica]